MSPTVPSVCFRAVEIDIKHQRKILTSFFVGGGHGLFGLILAAPLPNKSFVVFEMTHCSRYQAILRPFFVTAVLGIINDFISFTEAKSL